ncbi:hypothetical protein [Streptomyces lonarensis]|uniref:Uncharacterized protein n=1 Tax=Streptomyces lonarensis TaxID=700599 RepID=A0A7X6CXD3_9ACTN|nr:hypothetical protein [Streptomyces lonarensis]NJQ04302.1 hypothetical protein [Streptomyces lonarensis]
MDSGDTAWGAAIVATITALGTGLVAWLHKRSARETQRVATFESIKTWMAEDRERREARVAELEAKVAGLEEQQREQERQRREQEERHTRSQRMLMSYVRDLREEIQRAGGVPPPPPEGLDWSPWDGLD